MFAGMEVWGTMQAARRRGDDGGQRQVVMNFIYTPKGHCLRALFVQIILLLLRAKKGYIERGLPPQRLTSLLTVARFSLAYCCVSSMSMSVVTSAMLK